MLRNGARSFSRQETLEKLCLPMCRSTLKCRDAKTRESLTTGHFLRGSIIEIVKVESSLNKRRHIQKSLRVLKLSEKHVRGSRC
jgi:hypothetical protein